MDLNLTNSEKVAQFMTIFGQNIPEKVSFPDSETLALRMELIREEIKELEESVLEGDLYNTFKELADCLYVLYGFAWTMGVNLDHVLANVHDSNLSKLGPNGEVLRREDGKILKGSGYWAPDMKKCLEENGYEVKTN